MNNFDAQNNFPPYDTTSTQPPYLSSNNYNSQPTLAGQFMPSPPPPTQKGLSSWFKSQKKMTQLGLGCGTLLFVLFFCSCISIGTLASIGAGVSKPSVTQVGTTSLTPTTHTAGPANKKANSIKPALILTPTPITTQTPTSVPTQEPVPTPAPAPTQAPVPTQAPAPQPVPTQAPAPLTGINGNPWGYDFNAGNLIYSPPGNFCSYFNCIASFWKSTNGYVDECTDGTYSHSGGVRGACSSHGGEMRPLYSH